MPIRFFHMTASAAFSAGVGFCVEGYAGPGIGCLLFGALTILPWVIGIKKR